MKMEEGSGANDDDCPEVSSGGSSRSSSNESADVQSFDLERVHKEITLERMMRSGTSRSDALKIWKRLRTSHASIPLPGYINIGPAFTNLVLHSKSDLSKYTNTIEEVVETGDKISVIKAMKTTCQSLSRTRDVTASSCNRMRDAIVGVNEYDLWKYSPNKIIQMLKDPSFYDDIQHSARKTLRAIERLAQIKNNFFRIEEIDYVWVGSDMML
jgi:hypothetical protein